MRTNADQETEKFIIKGLETLFPSYNIKGEETGDHDKQSEYTFIIDPIEGTSNFVMGIPVFAINLGLMKGSQIQAGYIYNPITKDFYYAELGKGAFLNGKKITVNKEADVSKCVVDSNFSYGTPIEFKKHFVDSLRNLKIKRTLDIWCGGYSFCLLASGKIEAVLVEGDQLYDFIAGKLIVAEAGARITNFDGTDEVDLKNNRFIASNGSSIHIELVKIVN